MRDFLCDGMRELRLFSRLLLCSQLNSLCSKMGCIFKETDFLVLVLDSKLRLQVAQFSFRKFELQKCGYLYYFIKENN